MVVTMTDMETVSTVTWPKWCYTANNCNETVKLADQHPMTAVPPKHRRKKTSSRSSMTPPVKSERISPDIERQMQTPSGSSRSDSPRSPVDPAFRTTTFPGTPPQSTFSAQERFSPSRIQNKPEVQMPIRNYSDFMRSLAAKYNNGSSTATNDYYSAARASYFPALDPRFAMKPPGSALLGLSSLGQAAAVAAAISSKKDEKKCEQSPLNFGSSTPLLNPAALPMQIAALNQSMNAGLGAYPMMDMSSTQALLNIVRSASSQSNHSETRSTPKRSLESPVATSTPLDLSNMQIKKARLDDSGNDSIIGKDDAKRETVSPQLILASEIPAPTEDACEARCGTAAHEMTSWSVEAVSNFVESIDLCSEYAEVFKEHSIDGSALPLLTDEHLTTKLKMKLGPALKLRSAIAQKLGHCSVCLHCTHCHSSPNKRVFRNNYGTNH